MKPLASLSLVLWLAVAHAAGPTINIPPEIRATGDYVTFTPQTDAKAIAYVSQSGVDAFPGDFLRDPRSFVLPVRGLPAGRYNFVAVGTLNDEQTKQAFTVVVGDVPPGPSPGPTPPAPAPTDGAMGLTKASREGAAKVTTTVRMAQAKQLAAAHRAVAADLSNVSLKWPTDSVALADAVLTAKRAKIKAAADPVGWAVWAATVDQAVQALYQGGRLKTKADWQEALTELATGLEQ